MTETTDHAERRERIVKAVSSAIWSPPGSEAVQTVADAVLAVLPAPVVPVSDDLLAARLAPLEAQARAVREQQRAAVRAEVLREAADIAEAQRQFKRATGPRWSAQVSENVGILRVADELRRMAACQECQWGVEHTEHCPYPESHNWGCGCPTDQAPVSGPGGVAGETQQPELQAADRIVAHVPTAGTDLHCLRCTPPPLGNIWTAVTAEELEDGGICTKCGTDVLIPQSERPAEHRCPRCGESLTNYFEDDLVWRTGDDRPYCSGECVVAAHRADLKKPPMDPVHILGIYADEQPEVHGALLATRCDACRHTLNWHRNDVGCTVVLCVCGRFQEPAAVSQPETEA